MPCFRPLKGYRSRVRNPKSGLRAIVFNAREGYLDQPVDVPCGQCIGCRLERSRQWAIRCLHEAKLYEYNCFVTLTYDDDHLPPGGSLILRDFQLFLKKLRKQFGSGIRFFHCGEYGELKSRPHYHCLLFNFDFSDKKFWKKSSIGEDYYVSETLDRLWGKGHSLIGNVTFESAAYVARYVTKKVTGKDALLWYNEIDFTTGEVLNELLPEYVTMSRRPGIGKGFYDKFKDDIYPSDQVILRGIPVRPPRFYDSLYDLDDSAGFRILKLTRIFNAKQFAFNCTYDRLEVREICVDSKFKQLKRSFENGKENF